jgi:hypothetical protein
VTVFLRSIEYYEGILFLTTNRHECFDEAIANRIQLEIEFDKMTPQVRERIWRGLIDANNHLATTDTNNSDSNPNSSAEETTTSPTTTITKPDPWPPEVFKALCDFEINGREIKNLLRIAACCARADGRPLEPRYVAEVMEVKYAPSKELAGAVEKLVGIVMGDVDSRG